MPAYIFNKYRPAFRYFTKPIFISYHVNVNIKILSYISHVRKSHYDSQSKRDHKY